MLVTIKSFFQYKFRDNNSKIFKKPTYRRVKKIPKDVFHSVEVQFINSNSPKNHSFRSNIDSSKDIGITQNLN